jgi:activator of 2-hydroxyglutaryl-CoA dehydratase
LDIKVSIPTYPDYVGALGAALTAAARAKGKQK